MEENKKELSRNKQQYIVMSVVYSVLNDFENNETNVFMDPRETIAELCNSDYDSAPLYVKKLVHLSLLHYTDAKNVFKGELNNWKWERLPLLTRAILVFSYAHFYYYGDNVDKKIIINIAVELAKEYVDEKQQKFVNAILDKVLK